MNRDRIAKEARRARAERAAKTPRAKLITEYLTRSAAGMHAQIDRVKEEQNHG